MIVRHPILPALLLLLAGAFPTRAAVTILPFGDSITAGSGQGAGAYRHTLNDLLKNAGIDFEFTGPLRDAKGLAHAGHSGWNARRLRGVAEKIYREHPAEIVLLHAGHNNFAKDKPVPGIVADTRAIIETILGINPRARILLAQVIPAGKLPKYSYIPDLNRELATLARELQGEGLPVTLVDQASGFNWRTETTADKVHPNPAGAAKMAAIWFTAIRSVIDQRRVP